MAEKTTQQSKEAPVADAFPLTVDEFCARLSTVDSRVELIGAFHATEKRAGRVKDMESAFQTRFAAFVNSPA